MKLKPLNAMWEEFLSQHDGIEFVWLQFITYTANTLVRVVPVAKFTDMIKNGQLLSITEAAFYLIPNDRLAAGGAPTGAFKLLPDLSSVYRQVGKAKNRAMILTSMVSPDGKPISRCARSKLQSLGDTLRQETGFELLVGFEVEVVFMRRVQQKDGNVSFAMVESEHSWSSMTADDHAFLDLVEDVSRALMEVGIPLEQFHAEAAPGQWEFVLPPDTPVKAVDALIKARQTVVRVAESYGYRATLCPRPSLNHAGNGAHVHISLNPVTAGAGGLKRTESFFAGIIEHFPAILAFSLAQDASYGRVATGIWSGGEYAAWGWENKETPLRRITDNRFELKLMDGLANPYLALCAMLAAGLDGMREKMRLTGGDCQRNAADLSADERAALGIKTLLPKTLDESLAALEKNEALHELLGSTMIETYMSVKRGEAAHIRAMDVAEQRRWLISRY